MYDIIGDVHGHAYELVTLLKKLGYTLQNGAYKHPERKALFVGDYIDRGPQIRETLQIVKAMVDSGNAIALMGNHEYNAICFHMENENGGHLRPHTIKNIYQHYETLKQFKNHYKEYNEYIQWFKTLPLFFENEHFRAVHACWINSNIDYLKKKLPNERFTDELLEESCNENSELYQVIEDTLKGVELKLPENKFFRDKDGIKRYNMRFKWWIDPINSNYSELAFHPIPDLPEVTVSKKEVKDFTHYSDNEKIVFFGHYWLSDKPNFHQENICCLDYSVAKKGKLVAYKFNNEGLLIKNLIW